MRERVLRADDRDFDYGDDAEAGSSRMRAMLEAMRRHPVDTLAGAVAAVGAITILVNALFLQSGPHPAPIFANKPPPQPQLQQSQQQKTVSHSLTPADAALPRPRAIEPVAAPARPRAALIGDLQRELSRRGYYDGAADGVYGPRTDAAIRDFEQAAGLRASTEPTEALLQSILKAPSKAKPAAAARKDDLIGNLLSTDPKIMAVQRALSNYGYGQIKPTGVYDPETRVAIERFERERRLPITGQMSDRLTRELTALTGRPLE